MNCANLWQREDADSGASHNDGKTGAIYIPFVLQAQTSSAYGDLPCRDTPLLRTVSSERVYVPFHRSVRLLVSPQPLFPSRIPLYQIEWARR